MLWLYCSWVVILLGAVITAALPCWQGGVWRIKATPRQRFHDALRLLRVLHRADTGSQAVTRQRLQAMLPMAPEVIEDLLDRLLAAGVVRGSPRDGYSLVKLANEIRLADIYRLFVLESDLAEPGVATDAELAALIDQVSADVEGTLGLTLDAVFTPAAQPGAKAEA